ncbi:glycosyltransferase family 2 protein [Flavobacterium sp.]|jgi:glycosyltransferase involved in cell wall biosynthesis|uniref:glycosyltransferase family 2 protein n=1 Tax=Flavobacterium sp. TaxID=239 RepID=UPI0037BFAF90
MPFFTVIIPLYNKENYVENTLKSILNQTFTDYEVLVVNDCSTDESVEIIKPYLSESIKLLEHSANKGLSASRNTGIKKAEANYITFLDADDLWKPTFLETIYQLIKDFPEAKIFGANYEEVYSNKIVSPTNFSNVIESKGSQIIDFFKYNLGQGIYNHGSVCFHKSVYEKAGFYDETIDFAEDIDFNIRANYYFKLAYSNTIQMQYFMETGAQLTRSSILNKRLPDYDKYDAFAKENTSLAKYLAFEKYVLAKHIKTDGGYELYKNISSKTDYKYLNWKQKILLKLPAFILKLIKKYKEILIKKGIKFTSY